MKALEALLKQQQQIDKLVPKKSPAIEAILKQQRQINRLIHKNLIDLAGQLPWRDKIHDIKHFIPKHPAILNFNSIVFDNNISQLTRNFKWITEFERNSKLHSQFTTFLKIGQAYRIVERNLSELFEEFDETELEDEKGDSPTSVIITEAYRVKEVIRDIYRNNLKLFSIHPREFEKIIAELLYNQGFEVELTKQTRDNGYDILALKYIDNFSPIKYLVECKRYNEKNKIGVEIVRSFKEVLATEQANKGIIVTTSYFTIDAIKKQKETPYLLDYKNKDEVLNWVNEYMNTKAH